VDTVSQLMFVFTPEFSVSEKGVRVDILGAAGLACVGGPWWYHA
jgi:hypothetical protein